MEIFNKEFSSVQFSRSVVSNSLQPHESLCTEVRDIVQETGTKTIPMEKKCKKAKWLSEEVLKIAEQRRDEKGKEGKIYPIECKITKNSKER